MRPVPDAATIAVAKAICLAELGDAASFGEMRCCQAGGIEGCCLADYIPVARKAISAYLLHEGELHDRSDESDNDCGCD